MDENKENINEEIKIDKNSLKEEKNKKKKEKNNKIIDELKKDNESLKITNNELNEKILRITAEMQNVKRRSELDLQNAYKYDGIDLVEKLLPIVDNFERALKIKQEGMEKFLEGFKMVYDNLISILDSKGIKEIEALNMPFNPNTMNAVATEASDKESNIVLDVLQKGYIYNERIIRPAMVKVSE